MKRIKYEVETDSFFGDPECVTPCPHGAVNAEGKTVAVGSQKCAECNYYFEHTLFGCAVKCSYRKGANQ